VNESNLELMPLMSVQESFEPIDHQNHLFYPIGIQELTSLEKEKIVYIEIKDLQKLRKIAESLNKPLFYDIHFYYVIFDDIHYRTKRFDKIYQKYDI